MTYEELDAIKENGGFAMVTWEENGKKYSQAVQLESFVLLDPYEVDDVRGEITIRWLVGTVGGELRKSRLPQQPL